MIARLMDARNERAFWFGLLATVIAALAARVAPTRFDNYVELASAFLHHRVWIDHPHLGIDVVLFRGRDYIVNDPVPGMLLMPAVAIFGLATNQTALAVLLGGIGAGLAWLLAERLEVQFWPRLVICTFFFAGTDLWWCSAIGDVWFLAQVSAVAFTLLALAELARPNPRGWIVGLGCALAIGSRFTLVMALPVMMLLVARGNLGNRRSLPGGLGRVGGFAAVVAVFFGLWVAYNQARWGHFWDSGHTIFYHEDNLGSSTGSPFSLANVPYQIASFFLTPPLLSNTFPYIVTQIRGTALTWTSPALVFVFTARRPQPGVLAMWAATALVAIPSLTYYVNGFAQYGMRHALDFEPFLLVLMLYASYRGFPKWVSILTLYSVVASAYGIWYWLNFAYPATN